MKKSLAAVAVGLSLVTTPFASAPSAFAAAPKYGCTSWKSADGRTGHAKCTSMPSHYQAQVVVICVDWRGKEATVHGPWVKNGQTSSRRCSDNPNVGVKWQYHTYKYW
ncbi:hypothetical protein [Streptomyces tritici]|uniref:hypothetical protein n=1 Tax=Streptomyces tritici TaxID=2054410 RepID=UPI003AEF98CD